MPPGFLFSGRAFEKEKKMTLQFFDVFSLLMSARSSRRRPVPLRLGERDREATSDDLAVLADQARLEELRTPHPYSGLGARLFNLI
jgi:hypothetical protein